MTKKVWTLLLLVTANFTAHTQYFSGTYVSNSPILEFDYLEIHHHHFRGDRYKGDLTIKAISSGIALWERDAKLIEGIKAKFFQDQFGKDKEILAIYEVKVLIDGIEEDFILMGFIGKEGVGTFYGIEEIFEDETEQLMLEFKSFTLEKVDHIKK